MMTCYLVTRIVCNTMGKKLCWNKCVQVSAQIPHLIAAFQLEAAEKNKGDIVIRRQTAAWQGAVQLSKLILAKSC